MKIIAISDTHEQEDKVVLPKGDVLVHAGDITYKGSIPKLAKFMEWIEKQPFKHKIIISGNHDFCYENHSHNMAVKLSKEAGIVYLQDSGIEIDGVNFWGSPWTPFFFNWAFNLQRGEEIAKKWALIPENTNVLITHGPPFGILDEAPRGVMQTEHVGCEELTKRIGDLPNLKAHVFGHIHHSYGTKQVGPCLFVNASSCTEEYKPTNAPIVFEV